MPIRIKSIFQRGAEIERDREREREREKKEEN